MLLYIACVMNVLWIRIYTRIACFIKGQAEVKRLLIEAADQDYDSG